MFTPQLANHYKTLKESNKSVEIVFVSSDRDEDAFNERSEEAAKVAAAEIHDACAQLSQATRDALAESRRRVAHDQLPFDGPPLLVLEHRRW